MPQRRTPPQSNGRRSAEASEQYQRFVDTAKALECDDDKERFEAKLGKIARQPRAHEKTLQRRK